MPPKTKQCTAPGCEEKIRYSHFFCAGCFGYLPRTIKADLMQAYRHGMGKQLMDTLTAAREMLEHRKK